MDLDGVIAQNPLDKKDYRPFKLHEYYSKAIPTVVYSKLPINLIITGRRIHYKKVTIEWLVHNRIECKKLIMFPNKIKKTNKTLAEYKAKHINELGITKYYEDDKRIVEQLKVLCPNAEIELVKMVESVDDNYLLVNEQMGFDTDRFSRLYLDTV